MVTVVCQALGKPGFNWLNGVKVYRLPCRGFGRLSSPTYLLCLTAFLALNGRRYGIIHIHSTGLHSHLQTLFGLIFRRPVFFKLGAGGAERGDVAKMRPKAPVTRYFGLRIATRIQALSEEIAAEVQAIGVSRDKIVRIPNGYDAAVFHPVASSKKSVRRRLGVPADKTVVLFTGRFMPDKRDRTVTAATSAP